MHYKTISLNILGILIFFSGCQPIPDNTRTGEFHLSETIDNVSSHYVSEIHHSLERRMEKDPLRIRPYLEAARLLKKHVKNAIEYIEENEAFYFDSLTVYVKEISKIPVLVASFQLEDYENNLANLAERMKNVAGITTDVNKDLRDESKRLINTLELIILTGLYQAIDANDWKLDYFQPVIIDEKTLSLGQEYGAEIYIRAWSSTIEPIMIIGNGVDDMGNITNPLDTIMIPVKNGVGRYQVTQKTRGIHIYRGAIFYPKPSSSGFDRFPFKTGYEVK